MGDVPHGTRSGYATHACRCDPCVAAERLRKRNWYAANKERAAATARKSYLKHAEARKRAAQKYYRENQETATARQREYERMNAPQTRLRKYNITEEQYSARLQAQNHSCAICREPFDDFSVTTRPHVDHDHACCPGKSSCGDCVRGLLCRGCNVLLGLAHDDPGLLTRAINYLEGTNLE